MKIGEVAKLTGFSVQTIRFYEKEGLVRSAGRSEGNFRLYNSSAVQQLLFIKQCRGLDLGLSEIRQLLSISSAQEAPCGEINHMLDTHISEVTTRIKELKRLREQLTALRNRCGSPRTVKECGILQNLAPVQPAS